jgi:hypothetical protein
VGRPLASARIWIAGGRSWTDPVRCRAAGVLEDTTFATQPALAKQMILRCLDAGTPAAWAITDGSAAHAPIRCMGRGRSRAPAWPAARGCSVGRDASHVEDDHDAVDAGAGLGTGGGGPARSTRIRR